MHILAVNDYSEFWLQQYNFTTDLSVSGIVYELGFEHPQSFSKLFKNKTNQSPLAFRVGFN